MCRHYPAKHTICGVHRTFYHTSIRRRRRFRLRICEATQADILYICARDGRHDAFRKPTSSISNPPPSSPLNANSRKLDQPFLAEMINFCGVDLGHQSEHFGCILRSRFADAASNVLRVEDKRALEISSSPSSYEQRRAMMVSRCSTGPEAALEWIKSSKTDKKLVSNEVSTREDRTNSVSHRAPAPSTTFSATLPSRPRGSEPHRAILRRQKRQEGETSHQKQEDIRKCRDASSPINAVDSQAETNNSQLRRTSVSGETSLPVEDQQPRLSITGKHSSNGKARNTEDNVDEDDEREDALDKVLARWNLGLNIT